MIYAVNGERLNAVYAVNGDSLTVAYDLDGEEVYVASDAKPDYTNYSYVQKWGSKGIGSTQGFAIYNDKVFWVSKSGDSSIPANCYVWNLSDGSQALDSAYITIYSGHGNGLSFDFPKLYASTAYMPSKAYVNTLSNDYTATLTMTLMLDADGSRNCDVCVDEDDPNILWSLAHTEGSSDTSAPFLISKWDLTDLTDNGDGTYSPRLIQSVETPQPANFYFQGCTFHDGLLWYASGYSGGSNAYVYAIDPNTGERVYTIDCETTAEPEGIAFYPDDEAVGGYAMYVGFQNMVLRKYTFAPSTKYQSKSLSILGDSISTFKGYIPSGNTNFYSGTNCGVTSVDQTWWKRVMDTLGMSLNVNNSWSASRVTTSNGETSAGCMARTSALGTNPDVIIVYMGINDFDHEMGIGTWDGTGDIPTSTTTFKEAYAVMLNKIRTAYPNAELCCATLPVCEKNGTIGEPEINDAGIPLSTWNEAIRLVANAFNAKILDFANCGITYATLSTYMGDYSSSTGEALHPNADGHALIAQKAIRDLLR